MALVTLSSSSNAATDSSSITEHFPTRYDFTMRAAYHVPLLLSLRASLPRDLRDAMPEGWLQGSEDVECFEGQSKVRCDTSLLHQLSNIKTLYYREGRWI